MLIIIDEVSMVGSNMLLEIHKRLQQIKGVSDDVVFGGVSILAVEDLYQLPPVGQAPVFSTVSDCYAQLYGSASLWVDNFHMIELTEVMRQRGDGAFNQAHTVLHFLMLHLWLSMKLCFLQRGNKVLKLHINSSH